MELMLLIDHCFQRDAHGVIFSPQNYNYPLLAGRYLAVFDQVRVLARVRPAQRPRAAGQFAEGQAVRIEPVGTWHGPVEFLRQWTAVSGAIDEHLRRESAVLLVAPGIVGGLAYRWLREQRRPYAVEVVGDPWECFAPGSVRHPLRPVFRRVFSMLLRRQCAHACAVAYVTEHALQRAYPPGPHAYQTHYSSIELRRDGFVAVPRPVRTVGPYRLITVGSLAQMYKGADVLIRAVAENVRLGWDLRLTLVGDGKHRAELHMLAAQLGVGGRVVFRGQLPAGEAIRTELDHADLFVLPSRTEGLPRAAIEAMARGLPCIGSTVGGFPELLPGEDLVRPDDAAALAAKIREVLADPARRERMSKRNLSRAKDYREDILSLRRRAFYERLRTQTEQWFSRRRAA
ncbi:MAG: glycosyltransferase family 4 protein [Thermoguttaceae bacterium]|nr:glycosyltransferase family 4 protein [Thermoguttaceae bacterium]